MVLKFIDRAAELDVLSRAYSENGAQFFIVYGRRRVGKTELVLHFARERPHLYFLAREANLELERERFREKLAARFNIHMGKGDWEGIFAELAAKVPGRVLVVIDEFTNWVSRDRGIVSEFQAVWDGALKDSEVFLVLLGSYIGLMETAVLDYKSPLYGRRTGQMAVEPMPIPVLPEFFPRYAVRDIVNVFGCLDTIPYYLAQFRPEKDLWKNIRSTFLEKSHPLFNDAEILLGYELREPDTYLNILRSIQEGARKLNEIADQARVDVTNMPKYLNRLGKLRMVRKVRPVTSVKEKAGLYELEDNYFRFWLKFVYPYREEIGETPDSHLDFVRSSYAGYMGPVFEDFCRALVRLSRPGDFHRLGRWWYGGEEIDIVGLNEKDGRILLAECKWQDGVNAAAVHEALRGKAGEVRWRNRDRKESYAIFARSFKKRIDIEGLELFDLKDIAGLLDAAGPTSGRHAGTAHKTARRAPAR